MKTKGRTDWTNNVDVFFNASANISTLTTSIIRFTIDYSEIEIVIPRSNAITKINTGDPE